MGLKRGIPEAAMEVVEILRRDVSKPEIPFVTDEEEGSNVYWSTPNHPKHLAQRSCAMGLHPHSSSGYPISGSSFDNGEASDNAVEAFANWFDHETDPEAVLNAIWPKA